ncbi:MAG: DUF1844 domain-containing protein [Verrucomicrobiae bacterium]
MPEIQRTTALGEMTQKFIEFVMMQAQQAARFLGRIPNPQTGQPEVNLEYARMFIDQLEMIHEKTRGNLTSEESEILTRVLSDLQLAYVEAAENPSAEEASEPRVSAPAAQAQPSAARSDEPPAAPADHESRKKFTKSYGS